MSLWVGILLGYLAGVPAFYFVFPRIAEERAKGRSIYEMHWLAKLWLGALSLVWPLCVAGFFTAWVVVKVRPHA